MELKGKKVLVFGAGKSGIGAADLLNAVGACPVLYDGKADLDKESVLHKISGNYELPIYEGAVSYTHLDVNKRQDTGSRRPSG